MKKHYEIFIWDAEKDDYIAFKCIDTLYNFHKSDDIEIDDKWYEIVDTVYIVKDDIMQLYIEEI